MLTRTNRWTWISQQGHFNGLKITRYNAIYRMDGVDFVVTVSTLEFQVGLNRKTVRYIELKFELKLTIV